MSSKILFLGRVSKGLPRRNLGASRREGACFPRGAGRDAVQPLLCGSGPVQLSLVPICWVWAAFFLFLFTLHNGAVILMENLDGYLE